MLSYQLVCITQHSAHGRWYNQTFRHPLFLHSTTEYYHTRPMSFTGFGVVRITTVSRTFIAHLCNAWRQQWVTSYCRCALSHSYPHSSNSRGIVTMSHPLQWHVSQRFTNAIERVMKLTYVTQIMYDSSHKGHYKFGFTQCIYDKCKMWAFGCNTRSTGASGLPLSQ